MSRLALAEKTIELLAPRQKERVLKGLDRLGVALGVSGREWVDAQGDVYIYIYVAETFRVYFTAGSSFSSSAAIILILILL